jgi:hypothetical protein
MSDYGIFDLDAGSGDEYWVDTEDLRRRLLNDAYAMAFSGTPAAILDVGEIERAGPRELIAIARRCGML